MYVLSNSYKQTIGVDFFIKQIMLPNDVHVAIQVCTPPSSFGFLRVQPPASLHFSTRHLYALLSVCFITLYFCSYCCAAVLFGFE